MPHRPAMVKGHPGRLRQAFAQLLADGCRGRRPGDRLTIEFREDAQHAWVTIADGDDNAPVASVEAAGGLGVVAARLLLEPMQGSVTVERGAGGGGRFTVRLARA
jgi:two-component system sporulation sensor kinase B